MVTYNTNHQELFSHLPRLVRGSFAWADLGGVEAEQDEAVTSGASSRDQNGFGSGVGVDSIRLANPDDKIKKRNKITEYGSDTMLFLSAHLLLLL